MIDFIVYFSKSNGLPCVEYEKGKLMARHLGLFVPVSGHWSEDPKWCLKGSANEIVLCGDTITIS